MIKQPKARCLRKAKVHLRCLFTLDSNKKTEASNFVVRLVLNPDHLQSVELPELIRQHMIQCDPVWFIDKR